MKNFILLLTMIVGSFNINAQGPCNGAGSCQDMDEGYNFWGYVECLNVAADLGCDWVITTSCGYYSQYSFGYDFAGCNGVAAISGNNQISNEPIVYFIINSGANTSYNLTVGEETQEVIIYVGSGNGNSVNITYSGTEPSVSQMIGSGNGASWNLILEIPGCTDSTACNYSADASDNDGSCTYADSNEDCEGNCLDGYTELMLMWSGAVEGDVTSSFSVSGSVNGELYSALLDTESGSMTQCWMTDLQNDCFSIEIEGPSSLEWSLYTPLSDDPALSGINESMTMGSECMMGCMDPEACNYDSSVQIDDGSCTYADSNADCAGDCLNGSTELMLMWSGAVEGDVTSSFSVSGSVNGELYSALLDTESGSMTQCWMTDLQNDCFSIEIEGPSSLEWSLYTPLSDDPALSGINESMTMGSECMMGCMDPEGCNYDSFVQIDDGSCYYPDENEDCEGNCVDGYTQMYLNYDSVDKSIFSVSVYPVEEIYSATVSGSGVLDSCFPTELENECLAVEISGDITWSLSWIGTGGNLNEYLNSETVSDYATYNSDNGYYFGELCGYFAGCTDELACNYNNSASFNDGSCIYPEQNEDCDGSCVIGYTQMILNYDSVGESSFNVSVFEGVELYSATFFEGDLNGVLDSCFPTDLENECLAVEISGDLSWALSWVGLEGNLNEYLNSETIGEFATHENENGYYFGEACEFSSLEESVSRFNIFPNPSTSLVNISGIFSPKTKILIFNNIGKLVIQEITDNDVVFDFSNLSKGMYFINIISGEVNTISPILIK